MMSSSSLRRFATGVAALLLLGGTALPAAANRALGSNGSVVRLDSIVQQAIGQGATPGAAVAIGSSAGDVVIRTYGRTDWSKSAPAVTDSTLYDLASLTKVLAATPAAMLLVQEHRLELDAPISRYLSWWPTTGDKGRITVRQLLLHQAGFPAGASLRGLDRADRIRSLASRPLEYAPGTHTLYSDLSMVMLDAVIESVTGERIDQFVTRALYMPLEMRDTRYTPLNPVDASPFDLARIAPTLRVGDGHIQGTPQDPTARALDFVSGNAGLFSSIRDVARFAQLMLVGAEGMRTPVLDDGTIQLFTQRAPGAERALGWDAANGGTLFTPYFSSASFGHTGYTGTSVWIDPERDVFVVLLTNRLDPSAANEKHMALRRAVNALVDDHFAGSPPSHPGLGALAASLLRDLPFLHRRDALDGYDPTGLDRDQAAATPAWVQPRENGIAPHAGAGVGLLLLLLVPTGMALAYDPEVKRRARATLARVRPRQR